MTLRRDEAKDENANDSKTVKNKTCYTVFSNQFHLPPTPNKTIPLISSFHNQTLPLLSTTRTSWIPDQIRTQTLCASTRFPKGQRMLPISIQLHTRDIELVAKRDQAIRLRRCHGACRPKSHGSIHEPASTGFRRVAAGWTRLAG